MLRRTDHSRPNQQPTQTITARGAIVGPTRWAVAACSAPRRVGTCTFAIAPAVVGSTLVYV